MKIQYPDVLKSHEENRSHQDFLVVQWLRLHAPNAEGPGSIPGQETRSHTLHLKTWCAMAKTWYAMAETWCATAETWCSHG